MWICICCPSTQLPANGLEKAAEDGPGFVTLSTRESGEAVAAVSWGASQQLEDLSLSPLSLSIRANHVELCAELLGPGYSLDMLRFCFRNKPAG